MKLTKRWLEHRGACDEAVKWFEKQNTGDHKELLKLLIKDEEACLDWGNWYITRRLPKIKKVRYAVYAAKQVIEIYEEKYPDDKRPREAIRAAEKYIKQPTSKNKDAADAAAAAAYGAAYGAHAASYAADAAHAADAASYAAAATAHAAAYAAATADAAATARAAKRKLQIKMLEYGLKLLEDK